MLRTLLIALAVLAAACGRTGPPLDPGLLTRPPYAGSFANQVDPFIGTAGEGNTYPGAVAPWGMVSVSPHNHYSTPLAYYRNEPVAPAGYLAGASQIYGFGHTQLSGVGCPDLGAPLLAIARGALMVKPDGYRSHHDREVAWPGYYGVRLTDHEAEVEATASARVGVTRIRFVGSRPGHVLIDLGKNLSWIGGQGMVFARSSSEVEGWAETGFFCGQPNRQRIYFAARLSIAASRFGAWRGRQPGAAAGAQGGEVGAYFTFEGGSEVEVHLAISHTSVAGARRNLAASGSVSRGFEEVRRRTFQDWERELGRIAVSGGTAAQRTIFYTALYHALIHPGLLSDADGEVPLMGGGVGTAAGPAAFTTFSLWDTYRSVHPLLTLIYPRQQALMLRDLAAMTRKSGRPPKWELLRSEVNMMVGDPLLPVLADGLAKGLPVSDLAGLYPLLRQAAMDTSASAAHRPGNASYLKLGYIPMEEAKAVWGPVSTTLEYAYADWALSRLARAVGATGDALLLEARARNYRNLFDGSTGLLRPRNRDGSWLKPFNPDATEGSRTQKRAGGPGYVEGTAYQYAFFVPHDPAGLAQLLGGASQYVARLQKVFDTGRFTLWNEPDLAYPYLFTHFPGQAWRTQREVARARDRGFTSGRAGLPGNDDAGTLSAWYVFSALGFYPDCPGRARYSLGTPLFDRAAISLDSAYHAGRAFVIQATRGGAGEQYIRRARLDGKPLSGAALSHGQITAGGTLRLEMSAAPVKGAL